MKAAKKFKDVERAKDKVGCHYFILPLPFRKVINIINISVAVFCNGMMEYCSELFIIYIK